VSDETHNEGVLVTAIGLRVFEGKYIVEAEIGGKWIVVIQESGTIVGHIVESSFMKRARESHDGEDKP